MLSEKSVLRICVIIGIISWTALLVFDLLFILGHEIKVSFSIPSYTNKLFVSIYTFAIFYYFKIKLERGDNINFLELLWRSFFTGMITTVIALLIKFDPVFSPEVLKNVYVINIFYHVLMAFVVIFICSTFVAWKRLILYQKSIVLAKLWSLFEALIIISLVLNFLPFNYLDYRIYLPLFILVLFAVILSVNLKWVAYITFKQKWQSILLILMTLIYLTFIFHTLTKFSNNSYLEIDLVSSVFILAVFAFVMIYAFFSVLVILFNLPTSSVFEQKMEEVVNFQKLSQSLQIGQNEIDVYNVLLDTSFSTLLADSAWIEIYDENSNLKSLIRREITESQVSLIKEAISDFPDSHSVSLYNRNINKNKLGKKLNKLPFQSIAIVPITAKLKTTGQIVFLKVIKDGFTSEMINIVNAFVNQAAISIENSRLVAEALRNERYKEELTIARKMQKSLIPPDINQSEFYSVASFTEAAEEVGGDYYDVYKFSENKTAFIIGDVSGKGTSAAFHMAQLKGVFHSLVQMDLPSREFLKQANKALSRCLEKTSFITLIFLIVDHHHHRIQLTRAGHCPALFYDSINGKVYFLNTKGLGLGIMRNHRFDDYNDVIEFSYNPQDILLLYTDGIVEAKNSDKEEYGYERLRMILEKTHQHSSERINQAIIEDLYEFCGTEKLDDDYTLVIIKFN